MSVGNTRKISQAQSIVQSIADKSSYEIGTITIDTSNSEQFDLLISSIVQSKFDAKQDLLVSATNIKTINGTSIIGSGDLVVTGSGGSSSWGNITGTLSNQTDLSTALSGKISTSLLGAISGVATLDSTGKLTVSQIPSLALTTAQVVSSQTAMLALSAQTGDVAIRTDINETFMLQVNDPTQLGNWVQLLFPNSVSSVNSRTGAVVLTSSDVGLGNVQNTALSTWIGTTNLTTLGTISSGTWNATLLTGQYGGTGIANTGKTITLGGNLTTSGAFATTITVSATTSVTLPTSGTLVGSADTGTVTNTMLAGSIAVSKLASSTISGITLGNNLSTLTIGTGLSGASYNGSTGITIAVNNSQSIATLSNLTTNGFVKTGGGLGTLSIDTNAYITLTNLSSTATGLTYTNTTGVLSLTATYVIPTTSQIVSTFTVTGSSGAASYAAGTLNIPTYTLAGLGGQASSTNLTSVAGLTYASLSFVKMSGSGTFTLDTNTYLTANQSITLSGHITGSGTTAITTSTASKMILQGTTDASATAAQFLGALGTGLLKNTTSTGILSIAVGGTDFELPLGNPGTSGWILSSTTGGTRSWVAPGGYTLPIATISVLGGVMPDGTSITINGSGVISASGSTIATSSTFGTVKPDNTTITISGGVISSTGGYTLPTASASTLGGVKIDGSSITINGSGVISSSGGGVSKSLSIAYAIALG